MASSFFSVALSVHLIRYLHMQHNNAQDVDRIISFLPNDDVMLFHMSEKQMSSDT